MCYVGRCLKHSRSLPSSTLNPRTGMSPHSRTPQTLRATLRQLPILTATGSEDHTHITVLIAKRRHPQTRQTLHDSKVLASVMIRSADNRRKTSTCQMRVNSRAQLQAEARKSLDPELQPNSATETTDGWPTASNEKLQCPVSCGLSWLRRQLQVVLGLRSASCRPYSRRQGVQHVEIDDRDE